LQRFFFLYSQLKKMSTGRKETTASASKNIADVIVQDHNEAKAMYEEYKKATTVGEKTKIRNELIKALVKHDECEQMYAYPLLKDKIQMNKAKEYFDECLSDHQEMRTLLHHVRYLDVEKDTSLDSKMENTMQTIFKHMELEENEVLPLMNQHLGQEELKRAGHNFETHKSKAGTRPHPDAPPAYNLRGAAANAVLAPFDMARDFMEGESKA
jgi:hemerythrin-like domain-containing protein